MHTFWCLQPKQYTTMNHRILSFGILLFCTVTSLHAITFEILKPKLLATNMKFTEGPAWDSKGYVVFSDIDGNVIYTWSAKQGLDTLVFPAGNSNGILKNKKTGFIVCRHKARDLVRMDEKGVFTPLISTYRGNKLNSPNDLEQSKKGNLYFRDPDFGANTASRELPYQGLFVLPANQQEVVLIDSSLQWPNGVTLVDAERTLLVCESKTNRVWSYKLNKQGLVDNLATDKKLFVKVSGTGLVDGITTDKAGTIYIAFNRGGIRIFSRQAKELGTIQIPSGEEVRNMCFGGNDGSTLFVTAGKSLYQIDLKN